MACAPILPMSDCRYADNSYSHLFSLQYGAPPSHRVSRTIDRCCSELLFNKMLSEHGLVYSEFV